MKKRVFLIDGNSFCYRAFYAIKGFSNSKGEPTNAVYGIVTMLRKIIKEEKPAYIAVCFDRKEPTFRHEAYKEYKAHRKPMPDDLVTQMPRIKEVIEAHNIPIIEKAGYEADDLLGTLAVMFSEHKIETVIVTGDKDALQLVNKYVTVYSPYKDKVVWYNVEKVKERYKGLSPDQIVDVMALMGDSSDNIPGIPGIGEKSAIELIHQFATVETVLENADSLKSESKRKLINEHKTLAVLSKKLATIDCNVPLDVAVNDFVFKAPDTERVIELFKELEFKSLLKEYGHCIPKNTEKRTYIRIQAKSDFDEFIKKLGDINAFSFDTETTSANPFLAHLVGMSFSFKEKEAYYVALCHAEIETKTGIPLDYALKVLKPILEDGHIKKYGHNIKYDKLVLQRYGIILNGIAFDTMIAAYLINPVKLNQNLDDVSLQYLGIQKISFTDVVGTGKNKLRIDQADQDMVTEYASEDADCVFRLVPLLGKELDAKKLEKLFFDIEMPLLIVLAEIESNGVTVDKDLLKKLSRKAEKELSALTEIIHRSAGEEFNINSPKQLSRILFEKLKLPVVRKTKTGCSTDVNVLEKLAANHELPKYILEYREYAKLKSTYLDALPELINPSTGMIHTSFNQTTTLTGRLSSSEPNLQNIPIKTEVGREIRKAFIPRQKKRKLISADYSQIELRFLAHFSQDEKLIEAFAHGADIHTYTATLLYDVPEDEVAPNMRHLAKIVNFSIIYGKTPYGLSRDLNISVGEAQGFIDAYFKRYGKIGIFLEEQKNQAREKGFVTTILGRRAYFPDINSRNGTLRQFAERAATNAPLQGSASDLIKKAMIDISAVFHKHKLDTKMILQVHDELVFDAPEDELEQVINLIRENMESALTLKVPLVVDIRSGDTWYKE